MHEFIASAGIPVGLAIAGLLVNVSWRMAEVVTKLDALIERMANHERRTDTDIQRVHTRIDDVESKLAATGGRR